MHETRPNDKDNARPLPMTFGNDGITAEDQKRIADRCIALLQEAGTKYQEQVHRMVDEIKNDKKP